jgi:hypothetical protein
LHEGEDTSPLTSDVEGNPLGNGIILSDDEKSEPEGDRKARGSGNQGANTEEHETKAGKWSMCAPIPLDKPTDYL